MIHAPQSSPPKWEYPRYERGQRAALFIPCYMDQFYPQIGIATARLLARLGVPVDFPDRQTCCGQPAFNSGYWEEARHVIHHCVRVFKDYRYVVCPSASCTAMCRVFFGHVDPSDEVAQAAARVFELSEFLVEVLGVTDVGATFPHKVTMHSGCHGRRELGLVEPPLKLLQAVRDLTYLELPNIEECCGFGGTFSVKMAGTSLAMGRTKVENILKTGADVVVSVDISCLMHVGGILQRDPQGKRVRAMHLAEVLESRE